MRGLSGGLAGISLVVRDLFYSWYIYLAKPKGRAWREEAKERLWANLIFWGMGLRSLAFGAQEHRYKLSTKSGSVMVTYD